ncbi:hypothetical protein [Wolbachia endosymbiont (group A) of Cydia splendana]|nr:hypothetical protein [Wolbachia endosymbiont (group A) of Cydia splendana]
MRYLLSEERCNKAIPVSSTGMTAVLRHTAAVSQPLTSSGMTVVV